MKLELTSVDPEGRPIVLKQFPVIVGFDPSADICLDDSSVGHYQCMIDDSDGLLTVYDLGTKTGTTINGVRVSKKSVLMPGDELGIGKSRFVANYDSAAVRAGDAERPRRVKGSHSSGSAHQRRPTTVPV